MDFCEQQHFNVSINHWQEIKLCQARRVLTNEQQIGSVLHGLCWLRSRAVAMNYLPIGPSWRIFTEKDYCNLLATLRELFGKKEERPQLRYSNCHY